LAAPTDCGIGLPAATPETPYLPMLVLVGGVALAGAVFPGAVFLTGRRRQPTLA
jgi:hypothetical protein